MANKIGFILWVIRCFWKIGLIRFLCPHRGNHGKDADQRLLHAMRSNTQVHVLILIFGRMECGTRGVEFPGV
jgi:hypothetical protein